MKETYGVRQRTTEELAGCTLTHIKYVLRSESSSKRSHPFYPLKVTFVILLQPERLRDEEIERLEQLLQSQALGPIAQDEGPVPSNCFKFQNKVFGESFVCLLTLTLCLKEVMINTRAFTLNDYRGQNNSS